MKFYHHCKQGMRSLFVCVTFVLLVFSMGCDQAERERKNQDAWRDFHEQGKQAVAELELKNAQLDYELIQTEFGDTVARRWDKCLHDPPKVRSNQLACSKLLSQIKKRQTADAAAEKAKEAKW